MKEIRPYHMLRLYVKNAPDLRTISDVYGNYEMRLMPGEYYLIFKAGGFDQRESYLSVTEKDLSKNMQLFPLQDIEDSCNQIKKIKSWKRKNIKGCQKKRANKYVELSTFSRGLYKGKRKVK